MKKKSKLKLFVMKHCTHITYFSMCVLGLLFAFIVSPLAGFLLVPLAVFFSYVWIPDIFPIEARLKRIEDELQLLDTHFVPGPDTMKGWAEFKTKELDRGAAWER